MAYIKEGDHSRAETLLHVALITAKELNSRDGVVYIQDQMANNDFQRVYMRPAAVNVAFLFRAIISRPRSSSSPWLPSWPLRAYNQMTIAWFLSVSNWPLSIGSGREMPRPKVDSNFAWKYRLKLVYRSPLKTSFQVMQRKVLTDQTDEDVLALWGLSHDWYAQFLLDQSRYKEAFEAFQSAFLTCCEIYGETHSQSLVLLNSLGDQIFNYVIKNILRHRKYPIGGLSKSCRVFWQGREAVRVGKGRK